MILLTTAIGVWCADRLPSSWAHDDQRIVIDEVVGVWVTMLFIPLSITNLLIGFVLFRIFDIAKPLGIRKVDQMGGSLSVMVDDLLAGIYANMVFQVLIIVLSRYDLW